MRGLMAPHHVEYGSPGRSECYLEGATVRNRKKLGWQPLHSRIFHVHRIGRRSEPRHQPEHLLRRVNCDLNAVDSVKHVQYPKRYNIDHDKAMASADENGKRRKNNV
ncbi:Protein of unknown function [Gryllus bimaculatus]|nr:Protein of unknown function [Gryllus bimaculatus]